MVSHRRRAKTVLCENDLAGHRSAYWAVKKLADLEFFVIRTKGSAFDAIKDSVKLMFIKEF
jgi:hypothetical protein